MGLFSWLFDRFLRRSRDIPGAGPGDKAFLVGINNYTSSPLRGCVNDVHSFKALLLQKYGFKEANVRILLNSDATTKNMTDGLYWLASGAVPGDKRFHHFSGHGTQYPNASEDDGLSEVICLAGDTKIPLLDGRELTIKELASLGKGVWVYSIDKNGDVRPGRVTKAWMTSSNAPLLKVTLDNGKSVRCTPDHLWMMRDGSYKKAIELKPKDSLMPLYRGHYTQAHRSNYEYETVFNPRTNERVRTHQMAAGECPFDIRLKASGQGCGVVVHHADFDSCNNSPENLKWMTWKDHVVLHKASPEAREQASLRFKKMWSDPAMRRRFSEAQVEAANKRWASPEYRKKISDASKRQDLTLMREGSKEYIASLSKEQLFEKNSRAGKANKGVKKNDAYVNMMRERWKDPEYRKKMTKAQSESMKRRWNDPDERKKLHGGGVVNHKVASVEPDGFGEVFDINVPEFENFAVSSGVFLHNCPVDFDWSPDKMISDKAYYSIFSSMPKGVVLNWVSDSCHSGDLQRSLSRASFRSRSRFMKPTHEILALLASRRKRIKLARSVTGSFLDVGFVSACRSDQTASDTNIGGTPCGALSWFMVKELRQAASDVPLDKLVESVRRQMLLAAYDQVPQVEGSRSIRPFLMP